MSHSVPECALSVTESACQSFSARAPFLSYGAHYCSNGARLDGHRVPDRALPVTERFLSMTKHALCVTERAEPRSVSDGARLGSQSMQELGAMVCETERARQVKSELLH